MPRIISFDVGIKNLAYCVLDVSIETKQISIVDWIVVNLLEAQEEEPEVQEIYDSMSAAATAVPTCTHLLTSKKHHQLCGKPAKYKEPINSNNNRPCRYACEKHAKASNTPPHGFYMPKKEFTQTSLKKLSVQSLYQIIEEHKIKMNSPEKKLLKADLITMIETYFRTYTWLPVQTTTKTVPSAGKTDLIHLGRQIHRHFSLSTAPTDITHVLIENQISPIANRMKTIQGMLTQEFIVRNTPFIEYVSSANKLKSFEEKRGKTDKKTTYKEHKKDAVQYCREKLETNVSHYAKWLDLFDRNRTKKDDLADSFLQGMWYIEEKLLKDATNIKINNISST